MELLVIRFLNIGPPLLLLAYVGSDKSRLHVSRSSRRMIWAIGAVWICWMLTRETNWWLVISAVIAASIVEDTSNSNNLTPFSAKAAATVQGSPEAEGKADLVMATVAKITLGRAYTADMSQLLSRMSGRLAKQRASLHEVLRTAEADELNYILVTINMAAFVEVAKQDTMTMLCSPDHRLPHLTTLSRAALVDALQKVGLRYRTQRQCWARNICLSTHGTQLTQLKAFLDDGGDYHNVYKLLYSDMQGAYQKELLQHISTAGQEALQEHRQKHPRGPPGVALKIVSDVDDTLLCSGGFPGGRDKRYPTKCVYPGVLALYSELDIGYAMRTKEAAVHRHHHGHPTSRPPGGPPPSQPQPITAPPRSVSGSLARPSPGREHDGAEQAAHLLKRNLWQLDGTLDSGMAEGGMTGGEANDDLRTAARPAGREHQDGVHLVFLSARPETYKGMTEAGTFADVFSPMLRRGNLFCAPVLLLGSFSSTPRAIWQYLCSNKSGSPKTLNMQFCVELARKKISRFREYAALYPECSWLFMGDNGQGDILCAEELNSMLTPGAGESSRLLASLIHRVSPIMSTVSRCAGTRADKAGRLANWRDRNIFLHRTHVGMAVQARTLGFIDDVGLQRVVLDACNDLRWARARYGLQHIDWARVVRQLNQDILAANNYLEPDNRVSPIQLPEAEVLARAKASTCPHNPTPGQSPSSGRRWLPSRLRRGPNAELLAGAGGASDGGAECSGESGADSPVVQTHSVGHGKLFHSRRRLFG
ncbi:hypothetical protein WJX72_010416 [[Myrmecia] bisecta]|uniref:Phosphatidate phosphatase APP1 catalytic domain-containing protein n=1 Tax=[Myrmecia] bisecta TaxID=41462 RepID=A0AAW1PKT0_9CHLO